QIAIETAALAHAAQTRASVAERNSDRILRMARGNQDRNFQLARRRQRRWWCRSRLTFDGCRSSWDNIVHPDLNEIARLHPERFGVTRTDQGGIVPGQFRDWIGHFLQPGVVDVTAVIN